MEATLDEIAEKIGKGRLHDIIEASLAAQFPRHVGGGDRFIGPDFDTSMSQWTRIELSQLLSGCFYMKRGDNMGLYSEIPEGENPIEWKAVTVKDIDCAADEIYEYLENQLEPWAFEQRNYTFNEIMGDCCEEIEAALEEAGCVDATISEDVHEWEEWLSDEHGVYWDSGISEHLDGIVLDVDIELGVGSEARGATGHMMAWHEALEEAMNGDLWSVAKHADASNDNSMTWLLQTQGYDWCDYIKQAKEGWTSPFLESVHEEFENTPYVHNQLTLCSRLTFGDYLELMRGEKVFEVDCSSEYFTMGLFDKWNGSGSLMELAPEKPFAISSDVVESVHVENPSPHTSQGGPYGVQDVYGLITECWDTKLVSREGLSKPEVPNVDMPSLLQTLEGYHEKAIEDASEKIGQALETVYGSIPIPTVEREGVERGGAK